MIGLYVKYMQKWLMKYALFVVDKYCRALRLENRSVARVKCVAKPRLDNNVFVFFADNLKRPLMNADEECAVSDSDGDRLA